MLTIQQYVRAQSLEEAWTLNQKRSSRVLGGMMWLRMSNGACGTAIDLSGLGLNTVEETDEGFSIGCMTTLRALEQHEALNAATNGAIREALRHIVGVQFRNMATIGGSIFGRYGFSDPLTLLLALDADVELYKGGVVPLRRFIDMPRDRDILVRIHVKKAPRKCVYLSQRPTKTDFPVLTCAVVQTGDGVQAAIGARPGRARLIPDERGLLTAGIPDESARAFADFVAGQLHFEGNMRGSAAYRAHLCRVLLRRACMQLREA